MSEQKNTRVQRWKAALSEAERGHVERAFAADTDLEGDLEALVAGLSPKRRLFFLQRFVANLASVERGQNALLMALEDVARADLAAGGRKVTGFGDTPEGHSTR